MTLALDIGRRWKRLAVANFAPQENVHRKAVWRGRENAYTIENDRKNWRNGQQAFVLEV